MTPATDPNIDHLRNLVDNFRAADNEAKRLRKQLNEYVKELKQQGYSYPVLARETGMAINTIQYIINPDVRKRREGKW